MSELIHERPGVYSTYDASTVVSAGQASRAIGVAAKASAGTEGEVVILTSYAAGVSAFGEDETPGMSTMLRLLFANGASTVAAVRVAEAGEVADYQAAFDALGRQDVQIVVSTAPTRRSIRPCARRWKLPPPAAKSVSAWWAAAVRRHRPWWSMPQP